MFHVLIQVLFEEAFFHRRNSRVLLACTDAYLTPCLKRYIDTFSGAFEKNKLDDLNVLFMQSDGGLTPVEK